MKTLIKAAPKPLAYLHARMCAENKSFANYSGGNPMRAIIGKRADGAAKRYHDARDKKIAADGSAA